MKTFRLFLFGLALTACVGIGLAGSPGAFVGIVALLIVASSLLSRPQARCQDATLSVPEILMDVLDAFKLELFALTGWSTDFSSVTAVKGDKITAHIALLPVAANYDATTGFVNGNQAAETLIMDVDVTLDTLKHCPVLVKWLSQLASKIPLYREAIRNTAYVLAKTVLDAGLAKVTVANFTYTSALAPANFNLDVLEAIRTTLNTNKAYNRGRFGIINSDYAQYLQSDPRVGSALFYNQLNGDNGFRLWKNIAGFAEIREYPDMPDNGQFLGGFFGDRRSVQVASRQVSFATQAAEELGIPQIMKFTPIVDPDTGLSMTAVAWQAPGTGDVYYSPAILFGINAGKAAGANGDRCDKSGYRLTTQ